MFGSLGSQLDFPEHTLMVVSYTFIHNLEVAIENRQNLRKCFQWEG